MTLFSWIHGVRDPSYAYMVRGTGYPPRRRPIWARLRAAESSGLTGYGPVDARGNVVKPSAEELAFLNERLEVQGRELQHGFETRLRDVELRYGDVLRSAAAQWAAGGAASIASGQGAVNARTVWFRRGKAVVEIEARWGRNQGQMTHARAKEADALARDLAVFLAQSPPGSEPFTAGSP